jgi:2-succinyl-5-enolpyruvyl-6-hydroxy-3-cyclohexene-1-carboxylate synthase
VAERLTPDLVIRLGSAPTSSILHEWLGRLDGAEQVVVDSGGRWKDHAGTATHMVKADPEAFLRALAAVAGGEADRDPEWLPSWERVRDRVAAEVAGEAMHPPFEGALVAEVGGAVPAGDLLFVSGSLSVREIDTFLPHRDAPLLVIGNRGASGIDGIVSTAAGAAIATGRRVVAVVGDLALLHDSNGLATLRDPAVRVALVVVNNDGGGIFHLLPIREHEPSFTPCFVTPHGRDLSHLAALHGLPFERVEGRFDPGRPAPGGNAVGIGAVRAGLGKTLAREGSGILEIRTDPEENRRRRAEAAHVFASAAGDALTREGG